MLYTLLMADRRPMVSAASGRVWGSLSVERSETPLPAIASSAGCGISLPLMLRTPQLGWTWWYGHCRGPRQLLPKCPQIWDPPGTRWSLGCAFAGQTRTAVRDEVCVDGSAQAVSAIDQPALWERLPLLPELLGVRAPSCRGTRSHAWQLVGGSTAAALSSLGPRWV
jgi:hypothetical protein